MSDTDPIHKPQHDIQAIRDLLDGYGNAPSILKELIQNAEDAEATEFEIVYFGASSENAPHPLLKGPALCVVNNGPFKPEHREGIFSIGIGSKASDDERIGRFGKGLKSVFSLCEAFFVLGSPQSTQGWDQHTWFMNVYRDWRHADWNPEFHSNRGAIQEHLYTKLKSIGWHEGKWLAFWFPLRRSEQLLDDKGTVHPIHHWGGPNEKHPGENERFAEELALHFRDIAQRTVMLRKLKSFRFRAAESSQNLFFGFSEQSIRRSLIKDQVELEIVQGIITGCESVQYQGLFGQLRDTQFKELHKRPDWPKTIDQSSDSVGVKGLPHYGCIFSTVPSDQSGLSIDWAVFLPVPTQLESGAIALNPDLWPEKVSLILHGCFFLDSRRTGIDGLLNGFPDTDQQVARPDGKNLATQEWNRLLAHKGTLAHIPKSLAAFLDARDASLESAADLVEAIKSSKLWKEFAPQITQVDRYLASTCGGKSAWTLEASERPVLYVPTFSDTDTKENETIAGLWSLFPCLKSLSKEHTITHRTPATAGLVMEADVRSLDDDQLITLFQGIQLTRENRSRLIEWVKDFFQSRQMPSEVRKILRTLPLVHVTLAKENASQQWISADEAEAKIVERALYQQNFSVNEMLIKALPGVSILLHYGSSLLANLLGLRVPELQLRSVADIIRQAETIGSSHLRKPLLRWMLDQADWDNAFVKSSLRYLLHGSFAHRQDEHTQLLFEQTGSESSIWGRLIHSIVESDQAANTWRWIETELADEINGTQRQRLGLEPVGPRACLEELKSFPAEQLAFPVEEWSGNDIEQIVAGLYADQGTRQTAITILRRLKIHSKTTQGRDDDRVSIGDESGLLLTRYLLETPDFDAQINDAAYPEWEDFLRSATLIQCFSTDSLAASAQAALFQSSNPNGEHSDWRLSWRNVIQILLELTEPHRFATLLLNGLEKAGSGAIAGLGGKLRNTPLLLAKNGRFIAAESIAHLDGLERELSEFFASSSSGIYTLDDLAESVRENPTFQRNRASFLPGPTDVFAKVQDCLIEQPKWNLGLDKALLPADWRAYLEDLERCPDIPIASLILKLNEKRGAVSEENFKTSVLIPAAKVWESTEQNRYQSALRWMADQNRRAPYADYLKQVTSLGYLTKLLPNLSLINQDGKWRPAHDLIWPTEGPPAEHQLHEEHEAIIAEACGAAAPQHDSSTAEDIAQGLAEVRGDTIEAGSHALLAYLKSFEHCEDHAVLTASFAAACFDDPTLQHYAETVYLRPEGKSMHELRELLYTGTGGSSYDFKGNEAWKKSVFAFKFESQTGSRDYPTITGGTKRISLAANPESLLADSRHATKPVGIYRGRPVRELILRRFSQPEQIGNLADVWRRTLRHIVLNAYDLPPTLCPDFQSLKKLCGHSVQLRRVQSILLDVAEFRIKELRCHSRPGFNGIMADFDEARIARLAAQDYRAQGLEQKALENEALEREKRKQAEEKVKALLTVTPSQATEQELIEATRTRLEEYGYSPESTLMELFQNADDALSERSAESPNLGDTTSPDFILRWLPEEAALYIQHWGRAINDPMNQKPESKAFKAYSRDLEKMLSLNLSDKVDSAVALTGRFGLGFKSIFFLCDHPSMLSGRLNCTIRGGWYPVRPDAKTANALRETASKETAPDETTLFFLKDLNVDAAKRTELLNAFANTAPYLIYFAKSIQHLEVDDGVQQKSFKRIQPDKDNWKITTRSEGLASFVVFSEDDPASAAQWIFGMSQNGFHKIPDTIPSIWATAPTQENSSLGCCINGDWKLDAGRLRIAREHPSTKEVAEDLALNLRLALHSLYEKTAHDWSAFRASAGLEEGHSPHRFWQSFWNLATAAPPLSDWQHTVTKQADLIGAILWNTEFGAMMEILLDCPIIPTGLAGDHRRLTLASDATHKLRGILNDCAFLRDACLNWGEFQLQHQPGAVVATAVSDYVDPIRERAGLPPLQPINLADVIKLFTGDGQKLTASAASRLGGVLNREQWKRLEAESHGPELKHIRDQFRHIRFPTLDGSFAPAAELVGPYQVTGVDEVDREETRRAALAPKNRQIAAGFDAAGLRFFALCREKPGANAEVMATWVRARPQDQLAEVFDYLYDGHSNGELAQKLADALGRGWLDDIESNVAFNALSLPRKQEIWRLFGKVNYDVIPVNPPIPTLAMDPAEAYRRISDWWTREKVTQLPKYLDKFYGSLAPQHLPWPGDDAWGFPGEPENLTARQDWMVLLIHAALHTEGWYKLGRHREFLSFLERNGWIRILADPSSQTSDYTRILDEFLGDNPEAIVYYHSMRQFISFYASSRHLESVVEGLANVDKKTGSWPLREAFSLGLNTDFAGTGLVAPSFERGFGLGAHFVLRELYRLKRLSNPHGMEHAFVLPKSSRRFCEFAFDLHGFGDCPWQADVSRTLHKKLQLLDTSLDPTFDHCFDIPLSILADSPALQEKLLGDTIPAQDDDDEPFLANEGETQPSLLN